MTWVKIDDAFFRNPKIRAAGKDGRELYLAGLCHCADQLTDGRIAKAYVPVIAAEAEVKPAVARKLVDVELWVDEGDHYRVHDYLDWNPSAEAVRAKRAARAEAGRRGGQRSGQTRRSNAAANASPNGEQDRTPSPYPSPTDVNKRENTRESVPADWEPSPESVEQARRGGYSRSQLAAELSKFVNWHRARGSHRTDWGAEFAVWLSRTEPAMPASAAAPDGIRRCACGAVLIELPGGAACPECEDEAVLISLPASRRPA